MTGPTAVASMARPDPTKAVATMLAAVAVFSLMDAGLKQLSGNKRLLDPALDPRSSTAAELLARWGRLHATRSVLSSIAFVSFVVRLGF